MIQDNSAYVQNWSIAQALVVILCTAVQVTVTCVVYSNKEILHMPNLQVYFVKSFFKDPREGKGGGSGFKMRT